MVYTSTRIKDHADPPAAVNTGYWSNIAPGEDVFIGLDLLFPIWANITTNKYEDRQKPQDGIMLSVIVYKY